MKVLFVDNKLTGHHVAYAKKLSTSQLITPLFSLPQKCTILDGDQTVIKSNPDSLWGYIRWLQEIRKVAKGNKVDVIHFLYADVLYKGFGIGLRKLKKYRVIGTFHQVRRSLLRDLSRKFIFKKINCGVVHTNQLKTLLKECNIKNIRHIEYPRFNTSVEVTEEYAKTYFSIPRDTTTLVALGGTRRDKGLDILLEALKGVSQPFHLLIAGKEEAFTRSFIEEKISHYKDKVTIILKFLSDDEMNLALTAADVVVLPYRKTFDGASGPLADGVWNKKLILGSNHGSLGNIIESNHLGLTFETENIHDLRCKIERLLHEDIRWNEDSDKYRKQLDPDYFLRMYEKVYYNEKY